MKEFKQILKHRNAMLLWASRTFSRFGDALESLALMYLVYDLTGSALKMGTVMLFSFLPNILLSPFAGVIADKYNKKTIMVVTEMIRALVILLIPLMMLTHSTRIEYIYAIAFIVSIAESFYEPAFGVTVVSTVEKSLLPVLNSLVTTSNSIAKGLGYIISGVLIAVVGKELLFAIDGLTFFFSAFVAMIIIYKAVKPRETEEKNTFFTDLKSGFSYVYKEKLLLLLFSAIILISFLLTPISIFLPIVVETVLKEPATWAGLFMTCSLVGNILAGISFPFLYKSKMTLSALYLSALTLMGIMVGVIAKFPAKYTLLFCYLVIGALGTLITNWSFTSVQQNVDVSYMGRVGSIANIALLASTPVASYLSGLLIDKIYILNLFLYAAVLTIGAGFLFSTIAWRYQQKQKAKNGNGQLQTETANVAAPAAEQEP